MPDVFHDHFEISDILARYGLAIDQKDWALLSSCFQPDADLDYPPNGSYDNYLDFEAMVRSRMAPYVRTQHLIGTIRISIAGDTATATCYAQAAHLMASGDLRMVGTSYADVLARTSAGWRITVRRFARLWTSGPSDG